MGEGQSLPPKALSGGRGSCQMKKISLFIAAVLMLIAFSHSYGIDRKLLNKAGLQEIKQEAPDFILAAGNQTISLKGYTGRVVVLHFWATWCKPCREEFPLFEKMYQSFNDKSVVFLPIAIDAKATQTEIDAVAKEFGANFPVFLATSGNVTDKYWTWGVPVTYFIDKKGWIISRALGQRKWDSPEVMSLIESLLAD